MKFVAGTRIIYSFILMYVTYIHASDFLNAYNLLILHSFSFFAPLKFYRFKKFLKQSVYLFDYYESYQYTLPRE